MACTARTWLQIRSAGASEEGVRGMVREISDADHDYSSRPGRKIVALTRQAASGEDAAAAEALQSRNNELVRLAKDGKPLAFTAEEEEAWALAYEAACEENRRHAWSLQQRGVRQMEAAGILGTSIPRMARVSEHLEALTGFRLVPSCGYVRMHVFFLALRYKLFVCSPHVRPLAGVPFSKEPDYFHEVIGHAVSLQDHDFARVQQLLGEVALRIMRLPEHEGQRSMRQLGKLYWFTFETGACREGGEVKMFGGAVLSSSGESRHAFSAEAAGESEGARFEPWDAEAVLNRSFTDQRYQPLYYVAGYHEAILQTLRYWGARGDEAMLWACKPLRDFLQPPMTVALVDPYSSGRYLIEACRQRELAIVCVRSTLRLHQCDVQAYEQQKELFLRTLNLEELGTAELDEAREVLEQLRVKAVIPGSELGVQLADQLAEVLGLPGNSRASTSKRKDKFLMQEALRAAGVDAAESCRGSLEELLSWARGSGRAFPVVVKPPVSFGTQGVSLCRDPAEVEAAHAGAVGQVNAHGVVVQELVAQEYLDGTEYVVDTVSHQGRHLPVAVWEHRRSPQAGLSTCTSLRPAAGRAQPQLLQYVSRVPDALEVRFGAAHVEVMDVPGRGPVLVEINARMHGHIGPEVIEQGTGLSLPELVLDAFLGGRYISLLLGGQGGGIDGRAAVAGARHHRIVRLLCPRGGVLRSDIDCWQLRQLPSFTAILTGGIAGKRMAATRDKLTLAGMVWLSHEDEKVLEEDTHEIHRLEESTLYDMRVEGDAEGKLGGCMPEPEVATFLGRLPGWSRRGHTLERTFTAASFHAAVAFFVAAREVAERLGHPDLHLEAYCKVKVGIHTRSLGGLTRSDFELAEHLRALLEENSSQWLKGPR